MVQENDIHIAQAEILSLAAHLRQVDKAGEPYYRHPARVAEAVENVFDDANNRALAMQVAYLHDVLEDTDITEDELRRIFGINHRVIPLVKAISFRLEFPEETRSEYYQRLRAHKDRHILLAVKKADMGDNLRPDRLALLDDETQLRLIKKYAQGYKELGL